MQHGKRESVTLIKSQEGGKRDVAREITLYTHMLYDPREGLPEETKGEGVNKRSKCYIANFMIRGILTTALIDTGAEVTCLSDEFVNRNMERFRECPMLPINGVTLKGPMGGKAVRLSKQIYVDIQLPNCLIQTIFVVVPKLSKTCIIGIDFLDHLKSKIDLDNKTISFPHLEEEPSLRIVNEEAESAYKNTSQEINYLQGILWKYKKVFRKQPGRLTSYEHSLKVKEDQPFIVRSYPVPIAYKEKVDEEIQRMLKMKII